MTRISVSTFLAVPLASGSSPEDSSGAPPRGARGRLGYMAEINPNFNSPVEFAMYDHYLDGNGSPFRLSSAQFQEVVREGRVVANLGTVTLADGSSAIALSLNLYSSKTYDFALGSATLYVQNGRSVGMYDSYNFDAKPWGVRPLNAEASTRLVGGGTNYPVCYGKTPSGLGC